MDDVEIVVVANGCTDNTKWYLDGMRDTKVRYIWSDNLLGFPKAINEGLKSLSDDTEYAIVLNNDTIIHPPKNLWIDMLRGKFKDNPRVGIAGPLRFYDNQIKQYYIQFFCAMIKYEVIKKIGYLDEVFGLGNSEDSDYCVRAKLAGYEIAHWPVVFDTKTTMKISPFPVYHAAHKTIEGIPEFNPNIGKNLSILADRYKELPPEPFEEEEFKIRYSIVIPTYNHCEDLLKPCIESILQNTAMYDVEVIVSANGCTDNTKQYVESLGKKFKLVWSDGPLGYTIATNEGIKAASGENIILLNNDVVLLPQAQNTWINMLEEPFKDPLVGGTGPFLMGYPRFIVFFCAMIKRDMFDKFGLLDEIFSPGTCEDVDFCAKMTRGGYKIVQVPTEVEKFYDKQSMRGDFPIYHKGAKTFGAEIDPVLSERNTRIIHERYGLTTIKLNLGCGTKLEPGYVNIDLYNPAADMKADAKKLPLPDNWADEIMAIQMFEHLSPFEVKGALAEWRRVLKPNGKLVLEMPDILAVCRNFERSTKDERYRLLNVIYGTTQIEHPHLFGWYDEILGDHLSDAGFKNIVFLPNKYEHWGYNFRVECNSTKEG